ncbi:hypothetical protein ABS849_28910 [Klebsiella pneumoniae]|uniref:hypothetical protein n=1 Tax=Klebsiella pneumoniae complex TaxID=3390273 RepID=UPI0007A641C1|nr:hypothetical protein [Klebsiella variicola]HCD8260595.1 hypothetical protein [Klebsiella pneumoniae]
MKMADILVDFNKLVNTQHKTLFAGRANGRRASELFGVDSFDVNSNDVLTFKIPQNVVVSSSYFLGMLENILPRFSSTSQFYAKARLGEHDYEIGMLTELERAVERGLYKNEPFF